MPLLRRALLALALLIPSAVAIAAPAPKQLPPNGGVLDPTPGFPAPGPAAPAIDPFPSKLDPGDTPVAQCTRPDNCLQTDADGDGIPDMWEDKLALAFAPELHLAPQSEDWTRPANVDWYLARVHMRFEHDDCSDCQVLGVGAITQDNMWQQSHRGKNWRCAHKGSWHDSTEPTNFFLQPPNDATHNGAPASEWRAYDHVRRIAGGYDVQYWFFFAYNDSVGSFNHEADWEHIHGARRRGRQLRVGLVRTARGRQALRREPAHVGRRHAPAGVGRGWITRELSARGLVRHPRRARLR